MNVIIHWVGVVVIFFLLLYAIIYVLYRVLHLKVDAALSTKKMPALKPIPIPTKNQPTPVHKLAIFVVEVRRWEVVENWHFTLSNGDELVIPKGFRFDGASIPKPFWAILNPIGLLLIPGLLHDYGYRYDQIWQVNANGRMVAYQKKAGKEYWDNLFKEVGKDVNGFFLINLLAWLAVAIGGQETWQTHRKNNLKAKAPKQK